MSRIRIRKIFAPLVVIFALGLLSSACPKAHAFNPLMDVRDNLVWTFGKKVEIGEAVKLAGAGNLDAGDTATSALAGIADYRFMTLSYGGIKVNRQDAQVTDTFKLGLRLTSFFDLFKNPPTAEMAFMRDLNVGPALSCPVIARSHPVTLFLDLNYTFGTSGTP